jgi:hypothetical protein
MRYINIKETASLAQGVPEWATRVYKESREINEKIIQGLSRARD